MIQTVDRILEVLELAIDGDEALARCPHCKRIMCLEMPAKGSQYEDKVCGGWFEVSHRASTKSAVEIIGAE